MKLTAHDLSFERNYQYLFEKINFELNAGELLQVVGANGCGKTTLLRMLAGLIYAEEGKISWNDKNISDDLKNYQHHINYMGHQNGIKLYLTVEENIKWFELLRDNSPWIASSQNALFAMTASSEEHNQSCNKITSFHGTHAFTDRRSSLRGREPEAIHLSAGQKRRLALARLTLSPAKLWILDEPTTALDHEGQQQFFELLKKHLATNGMAIITSHHDLPEHFQIKKLFLGENNA